MMFEQSNASLIMPKRKPAASFHGTISNEGREAMLRAVRDEIRRLVDAEDFGVKQLASIAFIAEQQRALLAELAVQIREEGESVEKLAALGTGPLGEFQGENVMAPTLTAETYGGGVLRELVPLAQKFIQQHQKQQQAPRIDELVAAAATARSEGMGELADHLMGVVRRRTQAVADEESAHAAVVKADAERFVAEAKSAPEAKGNGKGDPDALVHP